MQDRDGLVHEPIGREDAHLTVAGTFGVPEQQRAQVPVVEDVDGTRLARAEGVPFGERRQSSVGCVPVELQIGDAGEELGGAAEHRVGGLVPDAAARGVVDRYVDERSVQPRTAELGVDLHAEHAGDVVVGIDGHHRAVRPAGLELAELRAELFDCLTEVPDVMRVVGLEPDQQRHRGAEVARFGETDVVHRRNGCSHGRSKRGSFPRSQVTIVRLCKMAWMSPVRDLEELAARNASAQAKAHAG